MMQRIYDNYMILAVTTHILWKHFPVSWQTNMTLGITFTKPPLFFHSMNWLPISAPITVDITTLSVKADWHSKKLILRLTCSVWYNCSM